METITREGLIKLCDDGVVFEANWSNRDSSSAQMQLAQCRALLAAQCEFFAHLDERGRTWDVVIEYRGFNYFEYGTDVGLDDKRFYVPTRQRLDDNKGEDWY